jgi:hypothetical protein
MLNSAYRRSSYLVCVYRRSTSSSAPPCEEDQTQRRKGREGNAGMNEYHSSRRWVVYRAIGNHGIARGVPALPPDRCVFAPLRYFFFLGASAPPVEHETVFIRG